MFPKSGAIHAVDEFKNLPGLFSLRSLEFFINRYRWDLPPPHPVVDPHRPSFPTVPLGGRSKVSLKYPGLTKKQQTRNEWWWIHDPWGDLEWFSVKSGDWIVEWWEWFMVKLGEWGGYPDARSFQARLIVKFQSQEVNDDNLTSASWKLFQKFGGPVHKSSRPRPCLGRVCVCACAEIRWGKTEERSADGGSWSGWARFRNQISFLQSMDGKAKLNYVNKRALPSSHYVWFLTSKPVKHLAQLVQAPAIFFDPEAKTTERFAVT